MTHNAHYGRLTLLPRRLGMGLAVVALLGQLGLGMLVPRQAQETVASLFPWIAAICHSDGPANSRDVPGKHSHPLPGWMVCPFSLALSMPVSHPSAPVIVPPPVAAWVVWRLVPPPARAPPGRDYGTAQPRGPPTLI